MKTSANKFVLLILAILAVYCYGRITYEFKMPGEVRTWWDTPAYLRISNESLLSKEFFANARPFVYPLILKLFQRNPDAIFKFQVLFSTLAWGMLAWSTTRSLRQRWVGLCALIIVLVFSLDRHILGWDTLILTESVSLSLAALMLACWLWLLRSWEYKKALALILVAFFFAFIRDSNAWFVLMQAILIVAASIFRRGTTAAENKLSWPKFGLILVAGFFCAWFLMAGLFAKQGARWYFPFQNILIQRVLSNPRATDFFSACGMPASARTLGQLNSTGQPVAWNDTPADFQNWRDQSGLSCYAGWLAQNPAGILVNPFADFGRTLAFPGIAEYFSRKFIPALPVLPARLIYPELAPLWLWGLKVFILALAFWKRAYLNNPAWWLLLGMLALEYPHYLLIWYGDAADLPRHALLVSVLHQYSLWLTAALLVDGWAAHFRQPEPAGKTPGA